jgi:hypothetical protein
MHSSIGLRGRQADSGQFPLDIRVKVNRGLCFAVKALETIRFNNSARSRSSSASPATIGPGFASALPFLRNRLR